MAEFQNDDAALKRGVERVMEDRKKSGLEGLVGGLECVIINAAPDNLTAAANELLRYTGLELRTAMQGPDKRMVVLGIEGGADFLVTCRTGGENPFAPFNKGAKTENFLDARLETYVFKCRDIDRYFDIQKKRGVRFLTEEPVRGVNFDFIQTAPSKFTGNSIGLISWKKREGDYLFPGFDQVDMPLVKPDLPHLKNIKELDHVATRVRAEERDAAILEFMELTSYRFDFAVYVESLNSITNVARLSKDDYAQVFTSGISPFTTFENSGPTERFIYNYGVRGHHMAFNTENIDETVAALMADGMGFLSDLVGSEEEGLKQIFSKPSPTTILVNEYIMRYGEFDGFFTKSNVTHLTKATDKQ